MDWELSFRLAMLMGLVQCSGGLLPTEEKPDQSPVLLRGPANCTQRFESKPIYVKSGELKLLGLSFSQQKLLSRILFHREYLQRTIHLGCQFAQL